MNANHRDAARVVLLTRQHLLERQREAQRSAADVAHTLTAPMQRLQTLARLMQSADRLGYAGAGRRLALRFERQVDDLWVALRHRSLTGTSLPRIPDRFRRSMTLDGAVFCCVDSIETRRRIFDHARDHSVLFIDGRMNAEVMRVMAATPRQPDTLTHYPTTLFTEAETYQGACTTRSTIYTASIAAGLMLHQFTRYLRGMAVDADVQLNLLAMEMGVTAVMNSA